MRHFEDVKHTALKKSNTEASVPRLTMVSPDFVSWSEDRIRHYEESLTGQVAPAVAVMHIDRIHVEAPVLEGTDDISLNRGVGHIAGTARVGGNGNVGIAGHRDGFFRGLKDIKIGDRIELEQPDRTDTYVVDRLTVVDPKNVSVLRTSAKPTLTLVTCYPFYYIGKAPQRFIVHAVLTPDPQTKASNISSQTDRGSCDSADCNRSN